MKIPFEPPFRRRFHALLEEVFDSNFLSEGPMVDRFEQAMSESFGGLRAVAAANGGLALLALLEAAGVSGGEVVVPSNTFMATPLAAQRAGARPVFADCNKEDLCLSFSDMKRRVTAQTKAVIVVHIGGHIAFEIDDIAAYLKEREIPLIEDCAHAHGGLWRGRPAGSFGFGGAYSFYATKTMPLGEGGLAVTPHANVAAYLQKWRNYGKFEYQVQGFNARMNEVTAALGLVQLQRLPMILDWKKRLAAKYDRIFENRVVLPPGMESGYYKYIVFDEKLAEETGKVFGEPCHEIMKVDARLPNTEWVKARHACPPIYYGWDGAEESEAALAERLLV